MRELDDRQRAVRLGGLGGTCEKAPTLVGVQFLRDYRVSGAFYVGLKEGESWNCSLARRERQRKFKKSKRQYLKSTNSSVLVR